MLLFALTASLGVFAAPHPCHAAGVSQTLKAGLKFGSPAGYNIFLGRGVSYQVIYNDLSSQCNLVAKARAEAASQTRAQTTAVESTEKCLHAVMSTELVKCDSAQIYNGFKVIPVGFSGEQRDRGIPFVVDDFVIFLGAYGSSLQKTALISNALKNVLKGYNRIGFALPLNGKQPCDALNDVDQALADKIIKLNTEYFGKCVEVTLPSDGKIQKTVEELHTVDLD